MLSQPVLKESVDTYEAGNNHDNAQLPLQMPLSTPIYSSTTVQSFSNIQLNQVPFWPQTEYQCGPAALSMALNVKGVAITPSELIPRLYIPNKQGAITPEILAVTRFYQKIPLTLNGTLTDIIRQLTLGRPVVILQNLGLDVLPKWHFSVVIGVDFDAKQWIVHSGEDAFRRMDFNVFERTWARADYWAMVVLSPEELPTMEELKAYGLAMVDFEQLGQLDMAKKGYEQMLKRQPKQLLAQMGLANIEYQQGHYHAAKERFEALSKEYAQEPRIWNNLAYTYAQLNMTKFALDAIDRAVVLSNAQPQFLQSQQEILLMLNADK
ncbi:PA2778 family cysteine peptidase [Thiomicrorhabdus aquaedulcis]|uniref:PA2778 family cysteine peptidase n=1 Tax=Thiomicrorhabdus aquaedulcis TaxID=2211106 RepID=UPI0015622B6C|nr:PA2778 family cysteine peptidase [Thiomicrorhabdus aquaedulcis]